MNIGHRIAALISEKGITQKQLSVELNISQSTLNGYVRGNREPDISMIHKIAAYFGVTIDYLTGYVESDTCKGLSEDEMELLMIYRKLYEDQQEVFIEQGKVMVKHNNKKGVQLSNTISKIGTAKNRQHTS